MIRLNYDLRLISKDNSKIRNKQGRYFLSKEFKHFENSVKYLTVTQFKCNPLEGDLVLTIYVSYRNKQHVDVFNAPKGVCDALQGCLYKNDRQIKDGRVVIESENALEDSFRVEVEEIRQVETQARG